jgi:hypothetical protein
MFNFFFKNKPTPHFSQLFPTGDQDMETRVTRQFLGGSNTERQAATTALFTLPN